MTSKLTLFALTNSKSLEIKMTNILSFYENMATVKITAIENIVNFTKPLHRSNDIVSFLIERETIQSIKSASSN